MPLHYPSISSPDATDLYGRSKALGEVPADHVINVRGSFIGPDHGFLHWLLTARGDIEAWNDVWWSGATVHDMARMLAYIALDWCLLEGGAYHAAMFQSITKGLLVRRLVHDLGLPVQVHDVTKPNYSRSLVASPNMQLTPFEDWITDLVKRLKAHPELWPTAPAP